MDFVFLLLGIICLHKNKQAWSFTIFIGLLTSYYQMGSNLSDFIVPHNVSDTGLLLMLYMLFYGYSRKVIYSYPVLKQLFWSIFCFSVFFGDCCFIRLCRRYGCYFYYSKYSALVAAITCRTITEILSGGCI